MSAQALAEQLAFAQFPTSRPMRAAFRLGCHSAWKGKTDRHCPYGNSPNGERGYRMAWLCGWQAGIKANSLRIG